MFPPWFRLRKVIAVVGWATLLGACSAGSDDADRTPLDPADSGRAAAAYGSAADSPGTTDREFPIPKPDGGEIITNEWSGTTGHITLRYPADRYDEIVAFYDDFASGSGWNRSEIGQGDIPSVNQMNLMRGWNIGIDPPTGDHLVVTLTVS